MDKFLEFYGRSKRKIAFWVAIIATALYGYLFAAQIYYQDVYKSDILIHMEIANGGRGYSLLYRVMEWLYKFTGTSASIVFLQGIIIFGTWYFTAKLINEVYVKKDMVTSFLLALPAMMATGIFIPFIHPYFYSQQLITQPYHNITYMGMRFFAVLAMTVFHRIFETYLKGIKFKKYLLLSVLLMLSTTVKPSFFYGFALTLLLFLIYDFIKTKCALTPLRRIIIMGSVVFLSLIIMFYQAKLLYPNSNDAGNSAIILIWGKSFIKPHPLIILPKLACGLTFPALVLFKNRKDLSRTERFTYVMYVIQLAIAILLAEKGPRRADGNFYWGVYSAAFFLYIITYSRFLSDFKNRKNLNKRYINTGTALMCAHLISSAIHFMVIIHGVFYIV